MLKGRPENVLVKSLIKIGPLEDTPLAGRVAGECSGAIRPGSAVSDEVSAEVDPSVSTVMPAAEATADFDAEKVQRMALAIREGRFRVNAQAIADKLIAHAQALPRSPSH
jgi:negative regulator of flagellin synthesis FlgM